MRLPDVQARLLAISGDARLPLSVRLELADLAAHMSRRRSSVRPAVVSERLTPEIRAEILECREAFPELTQTEIAFLFNVNPGRVSEIVRGKRS